MMLHFEIIRKKYLSTSSPKHLNFSAGSKNITFGVFYHLN